MADEFDDILRPQLLQVQDLIADVFSASQRA
jgi:hypothetical protein